MNYSKYARTIARVAQSVCLCFFITALAPPATTYTLANDYSVTIHGTSNLHNWDETVTNVSGNAQADIHADKSITLNALNIRMLVCSIKSDMGAVMNKNTYKALKEDLNPSILFVLTSPVTSVRAASKADISVKANLTIAGVTKAVLIQGIMYMKDPSAFTFEGSHAIKMSDYGVDPPEALLGTLQTGDEITIHLKTTFRLPAVK